MRASFSPIELCWPPNGDLSNFVPTICGNNALHVLIVAPIPLCNFAWTYIQSAALQLKVLKIAISLKQSTTPGRMQLSFDWQASMSCSIILTSLRHIHCAIAICLCHIYSFGSKITKTINKNLVKAFEYFVCIANNLFQCRPGFFKLSRWKVV